MQRSGLVLIGAIWLTGCAPWQPPLADAVGTYGYVTVIGGEELHLLPGGRLLACEYADEPFAETGEFFRERRGRFEIVGPVLVSEAIADDPAAPRYFIASGADLYLVSERNWEAWQDSGRGRPNACCGRRPLEIDSAEPRCSQLPGSRNTG